MKKLLVVFALGCLLTTSYAQQDIKDHTITFETLFGRHRVNSALGVNTDIAWILRYNNSTSAAVPYIYDKGLIELVSLNSIIFQVHKNIWYIGRSKLSLSQGFYAFTRHTFVVLQPFVAACPYSVRQLYAVG